MSKTYTIDGKQYLYINIAQDLSAQKLGKIVILQDIASNNYCSIPQSELEIRTGNNLAAHVALYRARIIGRTDVYAHRYFNKKAQKNIYSPFPVFKDRRPVKGTYAPLTDQDLIDHLNGQEFLGFYPMLKDNTTKQLILDFDGHHEGQHWQAVTMTVKKLCRKYNIPCLVELSQSGKGAHIWFFFAQPVAAGLARRLGDAFLKAASAVNTNISFSAFDRMFPSQSVLGNGQIGNLIAGPLQGERRMHGYASFVDDMFKPLADQWQALERVGLIDVPMIEQLLDELANQFVFRLYNDDQESELDLLKQPLVIDQKLTIIRANALYIDKTSLTDQQIMSLKYLASFHNPKFYEREAQRQSTFGVPRIISLFEENHQYLMLPRGLEDRLRGLIPNIQWQDETIKGLPIKATFKGQLRPDQLPAFTALGKVSTGILQARPGFGKTVVAAALIAKHQVSTLILVKNKALAEQWVTRLNQFLEVETAPILTELTRTGRKRHKRSIGTFFGNKKNRSGVIDVATIQSLTGDIQVQNILKDYGMVISDEVHHDAAYTYDQVIKRIRSQYLYGLSATPYRRDGQDPILIMRYGPIRYQTDAIDSQFALKVKRKVIPRYTSLGMLSLEMANNSLTQNREAMLNDEQRNRALVRDVQANLAEGRHVLLLTDLRAHVEQLAEALPEQGVYKLYGGQKSKENDQIVAKVSQTQAAYALIATGKYAGEGLDISGIDTIILAMPYSWKGIAVQFLGRMQRSLGTKPELRVYDYIDPSIPMLARMYRKRLKEYKRLDYKITEDQFSKQSGLRVYNGDYQKDLRRNLITVNKITIIANQLSRFLENVMTIVKGNHGQIQVILNQDQYKEVELKRLNDVSYTFYNGNLPNCLVLGEEQLWFSSDNGFQRNSGMTIQFNQPAFVKQFQIMMTQSTRGLDL